MRQRPIEGMSQSMLPDDLTQEDINYIIWQKEMYGFISSDELKSRKLEKPRTCLLYSIDTPVTSFAIQTLYQMNHDLLVMEGAKNRRLMAIAANKAADTLMETQKAAELVPPDADMTNFRVEVQDLEPHGRPEQELVNEAYRIGEGESQDVRAGHGVKTSRRKK
jgi:hypothetical protein